MNLEQEKEFLIKEILNNEFLLPFLSIKQQLKLIETIGKSNSKEEINVVAKKADKINKHQRNILRKI